MLMTIYDYLAIVVIASVWLTISVISIHFAIDMYKDYRDGTYSLTLFELLIVLLIVVVVVVIASYFTYSYITQLSQTYNWWLT